MSNAGKKRRRANLLHKLYKNADGMCFYCKKHIPFGLATRDHKTPTARGGGNELENLVLACKSCNVLKSFFTAEEFFFALEYFEGIKELCDRLHTDALDKLRTSDPSTIP